MKKNIMHLRILFILLLSVVMINSNAQTGLNFQGVARTTNNVILASQAITIKLSILQGSSSGAAEYTETRRVSTNAQGLFTAVIGDTGAISTLGNFATINWKLSPKFLKIEMDPAAGTSFITMGTTQFQYVAYSQFAKSVDAENIVGIVPVTLGGTGVNSLEDLKTALTLNNVNNTTDLTKPISTLTQTALGLKLNAADTSKYTKQTYTDSALLTKLNSTGNAATATTAGNITATTNTTLTSLSSLATVGTITSGVWSGTVVAIEKGGTGATTASAARTNLGLVIGTNVQAPLVAGTDYLAPTGSAASLTNFPTFNQNTTGNAATATTAGNITATTNTTLTSLSSLATVGTITSGVWSATSVAVEKGGTGATTASAARTNLGLVIGTNVQAPLIAGTDYLVPTGSAASLTNFPTFNQNTTGNAATATTAGNITATTNTTLTSLSSLATVGTITSGVWSGTAVAVEKGGTGLTSPGTNGNVLTSNGTAWISAAPSGARTHTLGEAFGGGIIFYVTSDGLHGLIAETQNLLSKCFWKDAQNEISKSSNHSTAGKLFTDWRLPTANELDLLLTYNLASGLIPGLNSWYYWSSTEGSSTIVRIQGYPSLDRTAFGLKYGTDINNDLYEARPIRAF
jgi:hypothetical protein